MKLVVESLKEWNWKFTEEKKDEIKSSKIFSISIFFSILFI